MGSSPVQPVPTSDTKVRKSPNSRKYSETRSREHLFRSEVEAMISAAGKVGGDNGLRDSLMVLLAFRHGLRISELVALRWEQVNLQTGHIYIRRLKGSRDGTHPLQDDELKALRKLKRRSPQSPHIFVSSAGNQLSADAARKVIVRAGKESGLTFPVHPHMLRHSCGYDLAARGIDTRTIQEYLGHVSILHTVRYTAISPKRFEGIWN